jgi:hypothetical protein
MKPGFKTGRNRDLFDIDRRVLLGQVNALRLTVRNALTELAMIAAENVFDKPLTTRLKQNALALNRMDARLDALAEVLARAKPGRRENRATAHRENGQSNGLKLGRAKA